MLVGKKRHRRSSLHEDDCTKTPSCAEKNAREWLMIRTHLRKGRALDGFERRRPESAALGG